MNTEQAIAILNSTPSLLSGWLEELPMAVLCQSEKKGAWHSLDIVKHLIYGEQTDWIPRLNLMVEENAKGNTPVFTPFDRKGHQQNDNENITALLAEFRDIRTRNLGRLQQLAPENHLAGLRGIHPELGPVNGIQLLATWVVHDQTHIYQVARNITSLYAREVGPWAAYLKIIQQNDND